MKFGKELTRRALPEWKLYFVDYAALKDRLRRLRACIADGAPEGVRRRHKVAFLALLRDEEVKVARFYSEKEEWCLAVRDHLDREVRRISDSTSLTEYVRVKKQLDDYRRELALLQEYIHLNGSAFYKILKKMDKQIGTALMATELKRLQYANPFLDGEFVAAEIERAQRLARRCEARKPCSDGHEERRVYTVGCFDLFHRGHENLLRSLREFGGFVVVGIHDDESYVRLKSKAPIDPLPRRMANVRQFADMVFVIPDTDPTPYIQAMVSPQDIARQRCCYVRGEDMADFPSREWVESVMPVWLVPRSESVSSSFIRAVYHNSDNAQAQRILFARTDSTGKPVLSGSGSAAATTPDANWDRPRLVAKARYYLSRPRADAEPSTYWSGEQLRTWGEPSLQNGGGRGQQRVPRQRGAFDDMFVRRETLFREMVEPQGFRRHRPVPY